MLVEGKARIRGTALRTWRANGRGSWIALVAAYVLLAQSLFAAFAIGASAAPLVDNPAGAVLCAPLGAVPAPDGTPLPGNHHLPDCCLTGCMMFGPAALPAPDGPGLLAPAAAHATAIRPMGSHIAALPRRGTPIHPRAPPATA